jgi:glycine dehydrogenase subunit 2
MVIFEKSRSGRKSGSQMVSITEAHSIAEDLLRKDVPVLPEVSELDAVRHYTRLSRNNFSIDTHPYPLGSCTMKYNPRGAHYFAQLPEFAQRHPLRSSVYSQGFLQCLYELQEDLKLISGMQGVSLSPMAGAQGEFAGVAMIGAYHASRQDFARDEMIVPDAAHGTNPASAVICGFKVKEVPTTQGGDLDLVALEKALGPKTAGIMLTNPSTLGVFERQIETVAKMVHKAGGLLYYDGANLNAIVGQVSPGAMGFDVIHMNLHKTFATPHGGGGPGSGPVACNAKLLPFMPIPIVTQRTQDGVTQYDWLDNIDCPQTIGRLSAFMGNAAILLRAHIYIKMLGREGLERVSQFATLNANYLMQRLSDLGYSVAFPGRRASHEFIISLKKEAKIYQITAMDVAKRLLDYQMHAPTTYFPLIVPECLLIEPTETESKQTLDYMVDIFRKIAIEMKESPEIVKNAPHTLGITRLDDVKAARQPKLIWKAHDM